MSSGEQESGLTYQEAGVDISAQDEAIRRLLPHVRSTQDERVSESPGGFAGLFRTSGEGYLATSVDGLGTKTILYQRFGEFRNAGLELVAAVFNDVVTSGAEPLFMLDYLGVPGLEPEMAEDLVAGMAQGLSEIGAALLGGEIAEMPDVYPEGTFDIVGFGAGSVSRSDLPVPEEIEPGDRVVCFESSGVHCNGLSLVRKAFENADSAVWDEHRDELGTSLREAVLTPARNYAPLVKMVGEVGVKVKSWAHVSGGGIPDNLARVLPEGTGARVDSTAVFDKPVFDIVAARGKVAPEEMWHVFNMGAGYLAVVAQPAAEGLVQVATEAGFPARICGEIVPATEGEGGEVEIGGI